MKHEPKFKIGDKLLFTVSAMPYDYVVIGISSDGYYRVGARPTRINTDCIYAWEDIFPFEELHKDFVLYDSPEGIWLRL